MTDLFSDIPQAGDKVVSKSNHELEYSDKVGMEFIYVKKRHRRPMHVMRYIGTDTLHYDDCVKLVLAE